MKFYMSNTLLKMFLMNCYTIKENFNNISIFENIEQFWRHSKLLCNSENKTYTHTENFNKTRSKLDIKKLLSIQKSVAWLMNVIQLLNNFHIACSCKKTYHNLNFSWFELVTSFCLSINTLLPPFVNKYINLLSPFVF